MKDILPLTDDQLEFNDPPKIVFLRVQDAFSLLWKDNPKLHDLGSVAESIKKYGFQELPKYDATLGAIKAGNGRIEALAQMERVKGPDAYELPRGLAKLRDTGEWVMPLVIGTDAESLELARAYAVDSNNLTLTGGDMTIYDQVRLWDPEMYLDVLRKIAEQGVYPVSVDASDIDMLLSLRNMPLDWHEESPVDDKAESGELQVVILCPDIHYEEMLLMIRQMLDAYPEWGARMR